MTIHVSVLLEELVDGIFTKANGTYFDGTIGFGGHTNQLLEKLNDNGTIIGTDKDIVAYNYCKERFNSEERIKLFHSSFNNIREISKIEFVESFDGIIVDLGVSSFQLDNVAAGFSFKSDAPLDMRMDKSSGIKAMDVINNFTEEEIASIIYNYGEEKKSRSIAKKIVMKREEKKIETSAELVEIISQLVPEFYLTKTLSRVFQALRIYVNDELNILKEFLQKSVELLSAKGRIGIITFHSLEDRVVKEFFKYQTLECICPPEFPVCKCNKKKTLKIITKKPIVPSSSEVKNNKRARSAKLRVAEKI